MDDTILPVDTVAVLLNRVDLTNTITALDGLIGNVKNYIVVRQTWRIKERRRTISATNYLEDLMLLRERLESVRNAARS